MKTSDVAFKKKAGLFTNYANANMLPISKVGHIIHSSLDKNKNNEIQNKFNFNSNKKIDLKMKSRNGKLEEFLKKRVNSSDYEIKKNVVINKHNTMNKNSDSIYNNNF